MSEKYTKDFDTWNKVKMQTEQEECKAFAHPREVWWCTLGVNIGAEIDGKNDSFERPVIVMKVYNKETMLVLPTTGRAKNDRFHTQLEIESIDKNTKEITTRTVYVKLTQARVISNKRLKRKVGVIEKETFSNILREFRKFT
jgi:mRNA interferase MazF